MENLPMENITVETVMSLLLYVLVNLLVLAALGATLVFVRSVILANPNVVEKLIRVAAFGAGLLTYVGARTMGMSIPELMASALAVAAPLSFGFLGVVFPALAGTVVAGICLRLMKKDDDVAARVMVLFSAFFFTMFADTYANMAAQAWTSTSVDLILPNITFVLGVVFYVILNWKPEETKRERPGGGFGQGLQYLKEKLPFKASSNGKEAPEEESEEPAARRDTKMAQEDPRNNARNL